MIQQASTRITPSLLEANGFLPRSYKGQKGVFYAKCLKAAEMPSFCQNVVDNARVFDTDHIVVEVCPTGTVQLVDMDSDYVEKADADSPEALEILVDAGFSFIPLVSKEFA